MTDTRQISIPNIVIDSITLINTVTKARFVVYPRPNDEPYIFESIIINEDMFSESVSGSLYFYDPAFIIEQLNFTSYDILKFKFTGQGASQELSFKITEIISDTNSVSKKIVGPFGNTVPVAVRFASDQLIFRNFDTTLLNSFIGRISNDAEKPSKAKSLVEGLEECSKDDSYNKAPGFVQYIFNEYGKNTDNKQKVLKADSTFNDMWFKINPSHYPWSKIGIAPKIGQMMNYVCEYACYADNPNAVNFFFWEDLEQFNFRCIESLLIEQKNSAAATYTPSLNEQDINAIVDLQIIQETPIAKLVSNGAFSGEYIRIKPDWSNPYRLIVDTASSIKRNQIRYDYYTDKDAFKKISKYPPIDQNNVSIVYAPNRISDTNYGYYQDAYSQKQNPWWNYWDPSYKYYEGEDVSNDKEQVERIEQNYWQAQFDFSELPGVCLKTVYEKIKWPLSKKRLEYAGMKRAETKWKFYRETILGERNEPTSFYAVLTSASKIYGDSPTGIYAYNFKEVEFWKSGEIAYSNKYTTEVIQTEAGDHPFRAVTVPWGIKGTAYNINEFFNLELPNSYETTVNGVKVNTTLIAPGIGAKIANHLPADGSSYPKEFRMQPIGRYYIKNTDDAVTPVYVGRIVKIDVINGKMVDLLLKDYQSCGAVAPSSKLYVFDVENSNDGVCSTG
jgi:hypothetical protein